jgi:hypothetical protein
MSRESLDFIVEIRDPSGVLRSTLDSDQFRTASGCPRTMFLGDCIERWNASQLQRGAEDRAYLRMDIKRATRRRRR